MKLPLLVGFLVVSLVLEAIGIPIPLSTPQTNFVFAGNATYIVTGDVGLYGATTIEGGAVIKYTNAARLTIRGSVQCNTDIYRSAIFTSMHDNSVGETVATSTGNPTASSFGSYALFIDTYGGASVVDLSNLRISYFTSGICFFGGVGHACRNVQVVNCSDGFSPYYTVFALRNALVANVGRGFGNSASCTGLLENVTFHIASALASSPAGISFYATNCLFAAVTNMPGYTGANNWSYPSDTGLFQTALYGAHYLASTSSLRNAGTLAVNPTMLSELQAMTTYPPLSLPSTIAAQTILQPQAKRDTNEVDIGYHYTPLDYYWNSGTTLTNAMLLLTNGVVVGLNGVLNLSASADLVSEGAPAGLNRVVRLPAIQEAPPANGAFALAALRIPNSVWPRPNVLFRFTDISFPAGQASLLDSSYIYPFTSLSFRNCSLRGISQTPYPNDPYYSVTEEYFNNAIEWSSIGITKYYYSGSTPVNATVNHNLFYGSSLTLIYDYQSGGSNPTWQTFNNAFHSSTFVTNYPNTGLGVNYTKIATNGFVNATAVGSAPVTLGSFTYQSGPLGRWYQVSTGFVDKGLGLASSWGLYHYTTVLAQTKEGASVADIGVHYVAVNAVGKPLDGDLDGLPDYFEDQNGDGVKQSTETDFSNPDSDGDGMMDGWERRYGLNPNLNDAAGDPDGDQLSNLTEHLYGSNPFVVDTDGDLLTDGLEVNTVHSNPTLPDTDKDGVTDRDEWAVHGTDPNDPDTDGDGLSDGYEVTISLTAPLLRDTDGDGVNDGFEVLVTLTNPSNSDTDNDGIPDGADRSSVGIDLDANGLPDAWESALLVAADSAGDDDNDGLTNYQEYLRGSDPANADTDGDGLRDGADQSPNRSFCKSDLVWFDDAVPAGATLFSDFDAWAWVANAAPRAASGGYSHFSRATAGLHQHYFTGATQTMQVGVGDRLFVYVYLYPNCLPSELMVQWLANDGTSWAHRAAWGADLITYWGTRTMMGDLPKAGAWVRLEVPASAIDLEGRTVVGMAFTLQDGWAAWDVTGRALADSDADTLPDDWERKNFGSLLQTAAGDPDADGINNASEYQGGTKPGNYWVLGWGLGTSGQTTPPSTLEAVQSVSAGGQHSLALKESGGVVAWGLNTSGQTSVPSTATNGIARIAAGGAHSLALTTTGSLIAWGDNTSGQCNIPAGLQNVVGIAAGASHSMALKGDSTVVVWGSNTDGQANVPNGLSNVVAVAGGALNSLALKSDGSVVAWGSGIYGVNSVPTAASNVVAIASGVSHALALRSNGTVVGWGQNAFGQLNIPANLTNAVAIAAGNGFSLALRNDGTIVGWGTGNFGITVPANLSGAREISAGNDFALAVLPLAVDTDADGLPDYWERRSFGNLVQTASGDADADGLTNAQEYANKTDPLNPDTDGDGLKDSQDIALGTNPLKFDTDGNGISDGDEDFDGDGLINRCEFNKYGSLPTNQYTFNAVRNDAEVMLMAFPVPAGQNDPNTQLHLSYTISGSTMTLTLQPTVAGHYYELLSKESLTPGAIWVVETHTLATAAQVQWTVSLLGPSKFFVGGIGDDSDGDGLSDVYEALATRTSADIADTGALGITDDLRDSDLNGMDNYHQYLQGFKVIIWPSMPVAVQGGGYGGFTISRPQPYTSSLLVNYSIANGAGFAVNGTDYQTIATSVTIPANQAAVTLPIVPLTGSPFAGSKNVQLTLSAAAGLPFDARPARVKLLGGQTPAGISAVEVAPPTVTVSSSDTSAAEAGLNTASVTFTRSAASARDLLVFYTVGGSAANGGDYIDDATLLPLSGVMVIPAGATAANLVIRPVNDTLKEYQETVIIGLRADDSYLLGNAANSAITLRIDDNEPVVYRIVSTDSVGTGGGGGNPNKALFRAYRTGSVQSAITFPLYGDSTVRALWLRANYGWAGYDNARVNRVACYEYYRNSRLLAPLDLDTALVPNEHLVFSASSYTATYDVQVFDLQVVCTTYAENLEAYVFLNGGFTSTPITARKDPLVALTHPLVGISSPDNLVVEPLAPNEDSDPAIIRIHAHLQTASQNVTVFYSVTPPAVGATSVAGEGSDFEDFHGSVVVGPGNPNAKVDPQIGNGLLYYVDIPVRALYDATSESIETAYLQIDLSPTYEIGGNYVQLLVADNREPGLKLLDSDGDGLSDVYELAFPGLDPFTANDTTTDTDGDGRTLLQEYLAGTDPTFNDRKVIDSDGDGVPDFKEILLGTNPLDSASKPPTDTTAPVITLTAPSPSQYIVQP